MRDLLTERLSDDPKRWSACTRSRSARAEAATAMSVTLIDKDLGYELRCADPIPFDAEYTRDLGLRGGQVPALARGDQVRGDHQLRRRAAWSRCRSRT